MTVIAGSVGGALLAQTTVLDGLFSGTTLDPVWSVGGTGYTPVLTASTAGGSIDSSGSGWLRLTSADINQATYAYNSTSFASTNATITASFNYVSYGGSGADGITFFLADASASFGVGAYGGSLGYAQKTDAGGGGADIDGMSGGYIGLGIDEFGNYSNESEGRVGGIGFYQDNVSVRGPGDGLSGYDYLGGTGSLSSSLDSPSPNTTRSTTTTFKVIITATNQLTVYADFGATGTFVALYSIDLSGYARPEDLIMGFTGSTGDSDNIHEVNSVHLTSVIADLWTNADGDSLWGTDNSWYGSPSGMVPSDYADILLDNTYVSTAQTIDVATNRTIRSMQIDAPFGYTLNNGTLTFNKGGIEGPSGIFVSQTHGSADHTINSAIALNQDIEIQNNSAGSLILGGNVANGGNDIDFNGSGDTALSGIVSGGGAITQTGAGTTTLSGVNSYTGGTTIDAGTVNANNTSALGSGSVDLNGGTLGSTNTSTVGNTIALNASSGLSGITTSGTLTQTDGSYTLNLAGATQSGAVNLSNNSTGRTLTVEVDSGSSTISGIIANGGSGAGGLTKTGTGELIISGNNTYTGGTTIEAGSLTLGASDRLANSGNVTIAAAGTLNLNGFSERINNLTASGSGASIDFGSSTGANTFLFDNYTKPASGVLVINNWENGVDSLATTVNSQSSITSGGIYISGEGVADYNGTATLYGGTRYLLSPVTASYKEWDGSTDSSWKQKNNWTTKFAPNTSQIALFDSLGVSRPNVTLDKDYKIAGIKFGSGASVSYNLTGSNKLTLDGAIPYIQQQSSNTQTIAFSTLQLDANTVADITGTGNLVINSAITGGNALIKAGTGSGKLILGGSGTNTYSGGLFINNGQVEARKSSALGTGTTTIASGATLELSGGISPSNAISVTGTGVGGNGAIRNLSGSNTTSGTVTLAGDTRIQSDTGATLTLTGGIAGSGKNLELTGAGNIGISSSVTLGTGGVTLNGSGTATYTGAANTYTGLTTVNSGTLALSKNADTISVAGDLVVNSGTVNQTATGQIGASSTVILNGGTYNLSNSASSAINQTVKKLTTATGSTVSIGNNDTLTISGNAISNVNGVISGTGGKLVTAGTGVVYLGGANTYTGGTTIGSVVTAANSASLGTGAATINSGGNLQIQGGSTLANTFTIGGTGTAANDGAFQNISGSNTVSGAVTLGSATRIQSDSGTLTLSGATNLGGYTLNTGGSGATTFSNVVSNGAITKDGSGTLTLSGSSANTFSGGLQINQGTVVLNKSASTNAIGGGAITVGDGVGAYDSATLRWAANNQLTDTTAITLNSDGALDLNGRSEAIGSVAGSGSIMIGTGQLIVGGDDSDSTLSGVITGSAGGILEKTGTGTLTLSSGTRNGGTINYGGEFNLNEGTLALNDVNFSVNTLRITGDSIIDFGGSSTLTVGTLIIELTGGETLSITSWEEYMDYFYADSVQNGDGSEIPDFNVGGSDPLNHIVFAGWGGDDTKWHDWDHQVSPVPEPASYGALLVGGLVGLMACRRRRRAV